MSDVIQLLPDSVANQIAAGEVIQRPASVVKELVENAIDAGATEIKIILKDAGRTLIQIIDNGCGMSSTDARLSFERHSTSKIRKADDLFSLRTMGFRGEALASIAAIAQVELRTQRAEDSIGTLIEINASKCERQEPIYYGKGSNFMIKNIFYNVPARRKFLKNNQVELSNIIKEFERIAIINHEIEFLLVHNDTTLHHLMPGSLKQRVVAMFGRPFETQLIPVNVNTTLINIDGFVCRPENSRKRNPQQFFFVNGRYMRHPYFHKAVMSSYDQLIPSDHQPNYFLCFNVDPQTIDVNIHPTKTEIKFENEQSIWQILLAAAKESLGKFSVAPSIDFDTEDAPEIPVFNKSTQIKMPETSRDTSYNPFNTPHKDSFSRGNSFSSTSFNRPVKHNQDWECLYDSFINETPDIDTDTIVDSNIENKNQETILIESEEDKICMQIKGKYIISKIKSGIMIVDQHRAHTLVLYEKLVRQKSGIISSQRVLFPELLNLSVTQNMIMHKIQDEIQSLGFDLSYLGDNTWSVNGVPNMLPNLNVKDTILQLIDSVIEGNDVSSDKIFEHIALIIARKAAIPYDKILTQPETDLLLAELLQLPSPNYTPDGKLIISILTVDAISKMF